LAAQRAIWGGRSCKTLAVTGTTFVLEPEVPGGWGPGTIADTSVHPPVVTKLVFEFAGWLGDHLVESFPVHLVSAGLGDALVAAGLKGFVLDDVDVVLDPEFQKWMPNVVSRLPKWRWLRVGSDPRSDLWLNERAELHVRSVALDVWRGFSLEHCAITPV
jgi:hypothetical protein